MAAYPRSLVERIAPTWPTRSCAGNRRQFLGTSHVRWKKTGPSPVDRRKLGSKHHLITEQKGIPLAVILTGANAHDVTQLLPLVDAIPAITGKRGRPLQKPKILQGDRVGTIPNPYVACSVKERSFPSSPNDAPLTAAVLARHVG
jgi:hypothetical protein